jgi:hypothetical protein
MNIDAKCRRNEHLTKRIFETAVYAVTRTAGSFGAWDLMGVSVTDVVVIQLKLNRPPALAERETLVGFSCPPNCMRPVRVWVDRQRRPRVTEL